VATVRVDVRASNAACHHNKVGVVEVSVKTFEDGAAHAQMRAVWKQPRSGSKQRLARQTRQPPN
jgi:hypothetical protein